jgi:hypothetical protein
MFLELMQKLRLSRGADAIQSYFSTSSAVIVVETLPAAITESPFFVGPVPG